MGLLHPDPCAAIDQALASIAARRREIPNRIDDLRIEDGLLLAEADRLLERRNLIAARP